MTQRTITDFRELDDMPKGSVVRSFTGGYILEKLGEEWYRPAVAYGYVPNRMWTPAIVLWEPEA